MRTLWPVPPRHIVKWERMKGWEDPAVGPMVQYSIRMTEQPIPEGFSLDPEFDPTSRSFYFAIPDGDKAGESFTTKFVTFGANIQLKDLDKLFDAVRAGQLPNHDEGAPYVLLPGEKR
jgi:hypothetical protein